MGERDTSIRQSTHDDCSHAEAYAALPGYATAIALGQAPQYPQTAAHLESCAACRAELAVLLELVVPAYTGQVIPATSRPHWDFSFLPAAPMPVAAAQKSGIIDELRRLVVEFSDALLASMQQVALAQPARGQALYRYTHQPRPPGNLSLTIDIFADNPALDTGSVQVLLDVPSRDPLDQSGVPVTLHVGELVWAGTTSETGSVTFTTVPIKLLSQLRIEVTIPPDK